MKSSFRLFALGFTVCSLSQATALDWPRWRGPELNGHSKETGWLTEWPASGPTVVWKAAVGIGFSSMSVADGRCFTIGNRDDKDTVYCFDAATGKELWKHTYSCPLQAKFYEGGPGSTPTVDGDRVFTFSKTGETFCLEAATGKVVWSRDLAKEPGAKAPTWGFAGSALVQGDLLLLDAGVAGTALDKKTGKVVWSSGAEASGYSTLVPLDATGNTMLIFGAQALIAVDTKTGKEAWRHVWKTSYDVNAADPVVAGDRIFISSGYERGAALLKLADGKTTVAWENKNMRNQFNSSVLWEGHLYGVDENQLRCLELGTGAVKWTEKSVGKGSLMLANGKLIVLSEKGELMIAPVTPEAFKTIARATVLGGRCWTVPVLANGRIYCRNAAGDVVCVDVRGK